MGHRKLAMLVSLVLIIASLGSLATKGLNFGLDFTGGTLVEVGYSKVVPLANIRNTIAEAGYRNAVVVHFGSETDILVRLPEGYSDKLGAELVSVLQQDFDGFIELRRIEFVGPQVGNELKEQGGLAMLMALGMVMLYIAFRFQFKFSIGAVSALAHDVLITLGIFSILQLDFDLTVLAAVLAVIGYSLNDTIVVFDRIRENFRKIRKGDALEVMNRSINQTLRRTILTSTTTLLVVITLLLIGGEVIKGFSFALFIGILVGTYSSIFIASPVVLVLGISREDMLPIKKENEVESDGLP